MLKSEKLINELFTGILNSYSMVFFSKNHLLALLLIAVSFFDVYAGVSGLVSVITANLSARFLGLNQYNTASGFYGFNALLAGIGLGIAYQPSVEFFGLVMFVALASLFMSVTFEGVLGKYGLPYLTIPFLLTMWLAELAFRSYSGLETGETGIYTMNTLYARGGEDSVRIYEWFTNLSWPLPVETYFKSLGAIFFQHHLLAGMIVAAGLLISSRLSFLLSVLGFASAWLFYDLVGADMHELDYSYFGFNFILTAIGLGGFFMIASRWSLLWVMILTPILSILISSTASLLQPYQLNIYSLPFNMAVLMFLYSMKFRERMLLKPETVSVQHFSPEENLYAGMNARERFRNQQYLQFGLPFYGSWVVSQGHNGAHTHREEWKHAWDFIVCDEQGLEFSGDGSAVTDYYCFGKPVLAAANGWIQEVADMADDNEPGDYNLNNNWGNTLIIRHEGGIFSKYSHLKKQSILYPVGSYVYKGQVIAYCGNSGRSPYPHLHFQFQLTPYIGSKTFSYPFSQYIVSNQNFSLRLSGIPEERQLVQNIEADQVLKEAFSFTPGQKLHYHLEGSENRKGGWLVKTDMLNNSYLECLSTGSKAYFRSEDRLFYFTWFQGSRKSLLYHFYLAAYKLPMGFYKNMAVTDVYPPTILRYRILRLVQDAVSPFLLFLKPQFRLVYTEREDFINSSSMSLKSACTLHLAGKELRNWSYLLKISGNQLVRLEITTNRSTIVAVFTKTEKA